MKQLFTLTITCFILFSFDATAQVVRNYSVEVEQQIKYNSDNGLDEYNSIQTLYKVTFTDEISEEQLAMIDAKLVAVHGDVINTSSTRRIGTMNIMEVSANPNTSYEEVKAAVGRFGFQITEIEKSYFVKK